MTLAFTISEYTVLQKLPNVVSSLRYISKNYWRTKISWIILKKYNYEKNIPEYAMKKSHIVNDDCQMFMDDVVLVLLSYENIFKFLAIFN